MGVEKFFTSLKKDQPQIIVSLDNNIKFDVDYMYVDFNSILYKITTEIEEDLNKILIDIIYKNYIPEEHQSIIEKYKINNVSRENFISTYDEMKIDEYFVEMTIMDVKRILSEHINHGNIKRIFISIDGIPNMAKIVEQRKRRYMSYVLAELKNYIYEKHDEKMSDNRKLFEKYRVRFSRSKFSKTGFMDNIISRLKSELFTKDMYNSYPNLETYICSDNNEIGEGEKKIMQDIVSFSKNGKYVIYSPDSDLIILSMIIKNQVDAKNENKSEFHILRYDQYNKIYDLININGLEYNIYDYICEHIEQTIEKPVKNNIMNDIVFIFNVFGNDFIHKIDSIDIQKDFLLLLNVYGQMINKKGGYGNYNLVYSKEIGECEEVDVSFAGTKKEYRLNYNNFIEYLSILKDYEPDMIAETYLLKKYRNYNHLKKILSNSSPEFSTVHKGMVEYCEFANIIFKFVNDFTNYLNKNSSHFINNISNNAVVDKKKIGIKIKKRYDNLMENLLRNVSKTNNKIDGKSWFNHCETIKNLLKIFIKIEFGKDMETIEYDLLKRYIICSCKYDDIDNKIFSLIFPKLKLYEYDDNPKSNYHQNKISEQMVYDELRNSIEEVDHVLYELDNMIGTYKYKLNAVDDNVGKIDFKIINGLYAYSYQTKEKYSKFYYDAHFSNQFVDNLCHEYFAGVCWIFDFYFNKNNAEQNKQYVSKWFYKYNVSPLIGDLWKFLKNKKNNGNLLDKTYYSVSVNKLVAMDSFFNNSEHYLYITPQTTSNSSMFPNLKEMANKINIYCKSGVLFDAELPIDCRRSLYLSKSLLWSIDAVGYEEFIEFTRNKINIKL